MKKPPKHQSDLSHENHSVESSPATTPVHQMHNDASSNVYNSFNSLDIQSPTNRNLSDKELRDCDVIGIYIYYYDIKITNAL